MSSLRFLHLSRSNKTEDSPSLKKHGLPPENLTLEITETVQLGNWKKVGGLVASLRELGCRISIDDFGSGYSSLAYLRTINADELKIDRSLVNEVDTSNESQFILDAILDLARSLKLDVVVEGIERSSQKEVLRELGCETGQGYLFDKPRPADEALDDAMRLNIELEARQAKIA